MHERHDTKQSYRSLSLLLYSPISPSASPALFPFFLFAPSLPSSTVNESQHAPDSVAPY